MQVIVNLTLWMLGSCIFLWVFSNFGLQVSYLQRVWSFFQVLLLSFVWQDQSRVLPRGLRFLHDSGKTHLNFHLSTPSRMAAPAPPSWLEAKLVKLGSLTFIKFKRTNQSPSSSWQSCGRPLPDSRVVGGPWRSVLPLEYGRLPLDERTYTARFKYFEIYSRAKHRVYFVNCFMCIFNGN